jgi:uncharacterized protein YjbI with pentapeptide repeats
MNEKCTFRERYYWNDAHIQHTFHCNDIPLESGYCIFHDPVFLNQKHKDADLRVQKLKDAFDKKLQEYLHNQEENWLLIGYIILGFELKNIVIEPNLFFSGARINGKLTFENVIFKKKLSCEGVEFGSNVNFKDCKFQETDFSNSHFHGDSAFSNCIFQKTCTFFSSKFFDEFSCSGVEFRQVQFGYAEFQKEAQFNNCKFHGGAHFNSSKFKMGSFSGSEFDSVLMFNVTDSKGIALTSSTINELDFHMAKADFLQFWRSRFLKEADFSKSEFKDIVDFRKCKFEEHLNFENTFFGEVDFSHSTFNGSAHFIETKFSKNSFFNYVKFERPNDVMFQRVDLSRVSFVNTDLARLNFGEEVIFGE